MKKILILSVLIVFVTAACHRKAVPAAPATDPGAAVTPAPAAADAATLEAGRIIYTTKCAKCHAAKVVENYTVEQWVPILQNMIPKAKLDDAESAQVTAYVNANAKK